MATGGVLTERHKEAPVPALEDDSLPRVGWVVASNRGDGRTRSVDWSRTDDGVIHKPRREKREGSRQAGRDS